MLKALQCLALCALFATTILAQESERSMAISVSPISLPFGAVDALFQFKMANFVSLTLPANFTYFWPAATVIDWASKKSNQKLAVSKAPIIVSGGLGARFYPTAKGMTDGFYLEPRFVVSYSQFGAEMKELGTLNWSKVSIIPKLNLGWDWFWDSGFYMNFGAGLGYAYDVKSELSVRPI